MLKVRLIWLDPEKIEEKSINILPGSALASQGQAEPVSSKVSYTKDAIRVMVLSLGKERTKNHLLSGGYSDKQVIEIMEVINNETNPGSVDSP